jgi:hypothetical protein
MKPALLAIEAVIAATPSVLVASVGFTIFLYSGFSMLNYDPLSGLEGVAVALGIVFALFQYCALASKTIAGKQYRFGLSFWLAVPFAVQAVRLTFGGAFSINYALIISCPIVLATLHFAVLQLQRSRHSTQLGATGSGKDGT